MAKKKTKRKGGKSTKQHSLNGGTKAKGKEPLGCSLDPPQGPTPEQIDRAVAAASKRTNDDDPLRKWTRPLRDECPLCLLPFPPGENCGDTNGAFYKCCGKTVCLGCLRHHSDVILKEIQDKENDLDSIFKDIHNREEDLELYLARMEDMEKQLTSCPFCRADTTKTDGDLYLKLAENGNHKAMFRAAENYRYGNEGLKQDGGVALEWYHRASDEGSHEAAHNLGLCYLRGDLGLEKNLALASKYFQKAGDYGSPQSFALLGSIGYEMGDVEGFVLNVRKAAICGFTGSLRSLMECYRSGFITKNEYDFTLKMHQAAINEMQSDMRQRHEREIKKRGGNTIEGNKAALCGNFCDELEVMTRRLGM